MIWCDKSKKWCSVFQCKRNVCEFESEKLNTMNYGTTKNGCWFSLEQLKEHDKQIRDEVIDECFNELMSKELPTVINSQGKTFVHLSVVEKMFKNVYENMKGEQNETY